MSDTDETQWNKPLTFGCVHLISHYTRDFLPRSLTTTSKNEYLILLRIEYHETDDINCLLNLSTSLSTRDYTYHQQRQQMTP